MDRLLDYQKVHFEQMIKAFQGNRCIVDASSTGTGKSYISLALALHLGLKPMIICPLSVIPSWLQVAKFFNTKLFGIANYEMIKGCKYYNADMENVNCPFVDKMKIYDIMDEENDFSPVFKKKKPKKKINIKDTSKSTNKNTNKDDKNDNKDNNIDDNIVEKLTYNVQFPADVLIIFDEAHRCKNSDSINSAFLLSFKKAENKILLLSATLCDKIEHFGVFAVLFDLIDKPRDLKYWFMKQEKANPQKYSHIKEDDDKQLFSIHNALFPRRGARMKIKELGDKFPQNNITAQSYLCNDYEKVAFEYAEINLALENLKQKENRAFALARILRARQRIELYKVPIFIDLITDALLDGFSIVVFVNFRDTMFKLADHFRTECLINGGQSIDERAKCINNFQKDRERLIICNIQSGSVGINLHDLNGNFPRMSLINPTWSGQLILQALGRIFRAGSKTPCIQKIIFCAGTTEEDVRDKINEKLKTIDMINDYDMLGSNFEQLNLKEVDEINQNSLTDAEFNNTDLNNVNNVFEDIKRKNKKFIKMDDDDTNDKHKPFKK